MQPGTPVLCNPAGPLRGSARLHAVREADPLCVPFDMKTDRQEVHTTSHLSAFYPPIPPKLEIEKEQKGGFLILGQEENSLFLRDGGKWRGCVRF